MGVYVKGMKVPEHYMRAEFGLDADGRSQVLVYSGEEEPDVYDVVALSPHGRLIDGDALTRKLKKEYAEELEKLPHASIERLVAGMLQAVLMDALSEEKAPTIIEKEGQ